MRVMDVGMFKKPENIKWPKCMKCGKEVDKVTTDHMIMESKFIVTFHCHGETESINLDTSTLQDVPKLPDEVFKSE